LNGFKDYLFREYWRLDGAYENLKNNAKSGDVLPYNNYPMVVKEQQVYVIDYFKKDKT
jgi:hypothetical protein